MLKAGHTVKVDLLNAVLILYQHGHASQATLLSSHRGC